MMQKPMIAIFCCLLPAMIANAASQEAKQKKILTKPLLIEDQGSSCARASLRIWWIRLDEDVLASTNPLSMRLPQ